MVRSEVIEDQYSSSLDTIRATAQQDLLDLWYDLDDMPLGESRDEIAGPYFDIVSSYGEQSAISGADYIFLQRALDPALRGLAYPTLSPGLSYEAVLASVRWATKVKDAKTLMVDDLDIQNINKVTALSKLQGSLNRQVIEPSRLTVFEATVSAGTNYARLAEPTACKFCLMLASRGAVYSRDTVTRRDNSMTRYHDNCRCLGIEVQRDDILPTYGSVT